MVNPLDQQFSSGYSQGSKEKALKSVGMPVITEKGVLLFSIVAG
jgi:hypothetical protein